MHAEVLDFVTRALGHDEVTGKRVLEVGALDVNGSVRPYLTSLKPAEYIGTDRRRGRRVDVVCAAERLLDRFTPESFDVVVCVETLEHVQSWRVALFTMCQVLRRGGVLVLTTRSPGFPRHEHPDDHWRFEAGELRLAFRWWPQTTMEPDPSAPGVFVRAVKADQMPMARLDYARAERAPALADHQRR